MNMEYTFDDDHYYAVGYDVEDDPYVYDNGVLINNYDIQNTSDLNILERKFTVITMKGLLKNPPFTIPVTVEFYQGLHKELFSNVYPWAGELRKVDICKGDTVFSHHQNIANELGSLFEVLNSKLAQLDTMQFDHFTLYIAELLGQLNQIHPFREGNGRTQRLFITALLNVISDKFNYVLDWSTVSPDNMTQACIEFRNGNTKPMHKLIKLNTTQVEK